MAGNAPADRGSKEATFTALAADFKLDDKIRGLFLGGPMENWKLFTTILPTRRRLMRSWQRKRVQGEVFGGGGSIGSISVPLIQGDGKAPFTVYDIWKVKTLRHQGVG